jgi:hypothetical protein
MRRAAALHGLRIICEASMAGPASVLDRVVISGALIGVPDQKRDQRSPHWAFFVLKNT